MSENRPMQLAIPELTPTIFDTGLSHNRTLIEKYARKGSAELIKRLFARRESIKSIRPTEEVEDIARGLLQKADPKNKAWQIVFDNLLLYKNRIFLLANIFEYPDMYLRDYVWTSLFTGSNELDERVLRAFEDNQKPNGQIPTAVSPIGKTQWEFAEDESSLYYGILASKVILNNPQALTKDRKEKLEAVFRFIQKRHVRDNKFITPQGERHGWYDSFIYPRSDVVTQNQGLYVVYLLAMKQLGLPVSSEEIINANQFYRSNFNPNGGYLSLSANFNEAPDISALAPEFLAITLFNYPLLSDDMVNASLKYIPQSKYGYKVVTANARGEYFDRSRFIDEKCINGMYQNGATWLFWDNIAYAVGELHGIQDKSYREKILSLNSNTGYAESIRTGGIFEELRVADLQSQLCCVSIPSIHKIVDKLTF